MSTTEQPATTAHAAELTIRPLEQGDVDEADRIMRTAFGTYLGAPDPMMVFGDAEYVRPRFAAAPDWAFAAELDGEIVGSNFASRWGSFGFFGPLTVRPDLWGRGIASGLMQPIMDLFERWQIRQAALFTFPQSPMHIALYQKFGFWPQYLTPLMARQVPQDSGESPSELLSAVPGSDREPLIDDCRELTNAIFEGLDVTHEIRATETQELGDTILLHEGDALAGFAVCHLGAGEAGSGTCFIKFGAVRPGAGAGDRFERLLAACEGAAARRGLARIVAGINTARHDAYRRLLGRGYRTWLEGVIMQRPNDAGYSRPDVYAVDDLR
jgi:GNAT superfamily N-acetyltransferase